MRLWCEVNSNEVPERQAKRLQYTDIEKNMYMETSKAFVPPDLNRSLSQSRPFSAVSAKSQRLNKTGMSFVMSDTVPYSDSQSFFTTSGGIGGGRSSVYRSNINNNNNTVVNGSELENPEMA